VFGTAVPAAEFLPMSGNTLELDPGWFSPQVMTGNRDLQVFNLYGEQKIAGQVDGPIFPSNGILLLVAAIGTDAITGSSPLYTHTISQANQLASLTIEKNIGGSQSLQFAGCRVGKLSVKAANGNTEATISATIAGQSGTVMDTPTAISLVNEAPYVFAEAAVTLLGNARAEVSQCQIDIDNGLKETYTFSGEHGPSFITPVTVKANGTIDLVFDSLDDATYGDYTKMENGSLGALALALTHPGNGGSITINAPQVALAKYANDLKIGDVVMSTLSFEGSKALPSGSTINAVVKNAVATAY
jgi:hypothetical protein